MNSNEEHSLDVGVDVLSEDEQDALIGNRLLTPSLDRLDVALGLNAFKNHFEIEWLSESDQSHPIIDLWNSNEPFAVQQVFTIGHSLRQLERVDARWVTDVVRHMKSSDRNNRVGYVFETIALAAILSGGHRVVPAPPNNKDYDADVGVANGATMRLSLKNFGASDPEREFARKAKAATNSALDIARRRGRRWYGVLVFCSAFPGTTDWSELEQALASAGTTGSGEISTGNWRIRPVPASEPIESLASSRMSYSVQIFAPHKRNEANNFSQKIERESKKFNAASVSYGPPILAVVMLRLSENATLDSYVKWAQDFVNRDDTSIAGIAILQSAIAVDLTEDTTSIIHTMAIAWKNGVPGPELTIRMPVGKCSSKPTKYVLLGSNGVQIAVVGHHAFNETHLFRAAPFDPASGGSVDLHQTPGTVTHGGFNLGDDHEVFLSPEYETPNKLMMYA